MKRSHAAIVKYLQDGCFLSSEPGWKVVEIGKLCGGLRWVFRAKVRLKTIYDMIDAGILDRQWHLTEEYRAKN